MKHSHFIGLMIFALLCCTAGLAAAGRNCGATIPDTESAVQTPGQELTADTIDTSTWIGKVEYWYNKNMNYGTVCLLMGIESSLIPFPSEAVIPPAAYVVDNPDSRLHWSDSLYINLLLIALFATLGSVLGAIFNYVLGLTLGRPLIYRFAGSQLGHLLMLNVEKIQRAEEYFNKHGNMSTFICRFIPAIRQLVSIPAGMARMRFAPFVGYTALGAFIWNVVLVLIGWLFRGQKELINRYSTEIGILILLLVAAVLLWFVIKWLIKRHRNHTVQS